MEEAAAPQVVQDAAESQVGEILFEPQAEPLEPPEVAASTLADTFDCAYVFAFLAKYSELLSAPLWPSTILQFEAALLSKEKPVTYEHQNWSDRTWAPTLEPILKWFGDVCYTDTSSGKRPKYWTFLNNKAVEFVATPWSALYSAWEGQNIIPQGPHGFFEMEWRDKLLLLRALTDFTLCTAKPIRDAIHHHYNLGGQRMCKRTASENELIIECIGRDAGKFSYFAIDDTPRIYSSGNPFKANCPWTAVCSTREELDRLIESLSTPASPAKLRLGQNEQGSAQAESALRKNLQKKVFPKLELGQARLEDLYARREVLQRQKEKKRRSDAHLFKPASAAAKSSKPVSIATADVHLAVPTAESGGRRSAAKRVDYRAIENNGHPASDTPDEPMEGTRRSKRVKVEDASWQEAEGSPAPGRSSSRTAQSNNLRASRRLRGATEDDDPVAAVAAYEAQQTNGHAGLALPDGADPSDYDLTVADDYTIWSKGSISRLIKGRLTAAYEVAQQQSAPSSVAGEGNLLKNGVNGHANGSMEIDELQQSTSAGDDEEIDELA